MRKTSSTMVAIVLALLSVGIVMLASTSTVKGSASFGDPHYFLKRQLVWLFISLVAAVIFVRFDYHWWQKMAVPLTIVTAVLLVMVFIPKMGLKVGGSHRWLRLGFLSFQPSEFAKFASIIAMSSWMVQAGRKVMNVKEGFIYPLCGLGVILCLIMLEPDFGTTLLIGAVSMLIMFAGGTRLSYLFAGGLLGLCGFILAVMRDPIRLKRILSFLWPDQFSAGAYHLMQSKIAFELGGLFGKGLGNSLQKHLYLPEAHTDFILAIIGEELGFIATLIVVLLFTGFLICGMIITFKAPDPFGRLVAFGITMMISLQAAINIGVVTGCLPTKGLPLPFISYGGSSLLMAAIGVCVLLNIAQHAGEDHADDHTRIIKDNAHVF
ncbi:MAG: putative lipid II flippase FtsW [Kiritimatiellae bacterium]|nr:putative lipid II flippase FtsW [Kiritimatiellia bacterium]